MKTPPTPEFFDTYDLPTRIGNTRLALAKTASEMSDEAVLAKLTEGMTPDLAQRIAAQHSPEQHRQMWVQREIDRIFPAAKPGSPPQHPAAIRFVGPWTIPMDGWGEHTRRLALALHQQGVILHLHSLGARRAPELVSYTDVLSPLTETTAQKFVMSVHHVVPENNLLSEIAFRPASVEGGLTEEELRHLNSFRVISTVYERDPIPAQDAQALAQFRQIWVPSSRCQRALAGAGLDPKRIRVIPIPHLKSDPNRQKWLRDPDHERPLLRSLFDAPRGRMTGPDRSRALPPVFLHVGKWEPRKDQPKSIEAFFRAFRPGEALFVLKTWVPTNALFSHESMGEHRMRSPADCLSHLSAAAQANGWTPERAEAHVRIVDTMWNDERMVELTHESDVYVSLSHGEGFGMPAADAKLQCKLMVYCPSGGVEDFASETDYVVPVKRPIATHPIYGWPTGSVYDDYDLVDAVQALRAAREGVLRTQAILATPPSGKDLDAIWDRGRRIRQFQLAKVGRRMVECLSEIHPVPSRPKPSTSAEGSE